jgi:hypothetical protein
MDDDESTEISSEAIDALKAKYPKAELHLLKHAGGSVVVRTPTRQEHQKFIDDLSDKDSAGVALRYLVETCVAWPEKAEFRGMLESRPFLVQSIGNELTEIFGLKRIADRKKL